MDFVLQNDRHLLTDCGLSVPYDDIGAGQQRIYHFFAWRHDAIRCIKDDFQSMDPSGKFSAKF